MTQQEVLLKVEELVKYGQMVRCYFKDQSRSPIYGKFVEWTDSKELKSKGIVRFVTESKLEMWEETRYAIYSRLLKIDNFSMFKTF